MKQETIHNGKDWQWEQSEKRRRRKNDDECRSTVLLLRFQHRLQLSDKLLCFEKQKKSEKRKNPIKPTVDEKRKEKKTPRPHCLSQVKVKD